jgi:hypothetical protein
MDENNEQTGWMPVHKGNRLNTKYAAFVGKFGAANAGYFFIPLVSMPAIIIKSIVVGVFLEGNPSMQFALLALTEGISVGALFLWRPFALKNSNFHRGSSSLSNLIVLILGQFSSTAADGSKATIEKMLTMVLLLTIAHEVFRSLSIPTCLKVRCRNTRKRCLTCCIIFRKLCGNPYRYCLRSREKRRRRRRFAAAAAKILAREEQREHKMENIELAENNSEALGVEEVEKDKAGDEYPKHRENLMGDACEARSREHREERAIAKKLFGVEHPELKGASLEAAFARDWELDSQRRRRGVGDMEFSGAALHTKAEVLRISLKSSLLYQKKLIQTMRGDD